MITSTEEFLKNIHLLSPIYVLTTDRQAIENKAYFKKVTTTTSSGEEKEDYVYVTIADDESVNPAERGYYEAALHNTPPRFALLLPSAETIYDVNLNTRVINAPEFLSIETDHFAETIYFKVDRYFDNMDLSQTVCIIQYENNNLLDADGQLAGGFIYLVPFYDTKSFEDEDKMLIPWAIGGPATMAAGTVTFAIRFYRLNSDGTELIYNLNTMPVQSKVLHGMNVLNGNNENFIIPDYTIAALYQEINLVRSLTNFCWEDAF